MVWMLALGVLVLLVLFYVTGKRAIRRDQADAAQQLSEELVRGRTPARARNLASLRADADSTAGSIGQHMPKMEVEAAIAAARRRPIVFRQHFPPPREPGRSFFGGVPVGPPDMVWPRSELDGKPLTFIVQWDAAALAAEDATGLLPSEGALYFFSNHDWGDRLQFKFVQIAGGNHDWQPLAIPDDLPPMLGTEVAAQVPFASRHVSADQQDLPRLLPCWPFMPLAIDYPTGPTAEADEMSEVRFWRDRTDVQESLLRAQDPTTAPSIAPDSVRATFERPFPAFPHDWAAVRVVAAAALRELEVVSDMIWKRFAPDADAAMRGDLAAEWRTIALTLYDRAVDHSLGEPLPMSLADAIWGEIRRLEPLLWLHLREVIETAVDVSLGIGSAGIASIPTEFVEACKPAHSLATAQLRLEYEFEFRKRLGLDGEYKKVAAIARASSEQADWQPVLALERDMSEQYRAAKAAGELPRIRTVWAPTPNRIFGPASYVQGYVEEYVDAWLLLLEMRSSDELGIPLGDGVIQYLIRPEDLAAGRFEHVKVVASGY